MKTILVFFASCFFYFTPLPAFSQQKVQTDLTTASLISAPGMTGPEKKAALMLVEEVQKRCNVRWTAATELPKAGQSAVLLGRRSELARAFPELANALKTAGN